MAGREVRAGGAYVELGLRAKLDAGLKRAATKLRSFGRSAIAIGGGITAAASAALGSVIFSGAKFASVGDDIGKMSKRTDIGVESLQELGFAARQSGSDLQTLENGSKRMQRVINDAANGLSSAQRSLDQIGIDPNALAGKSTEEQLTMISRGLANVDNQSKKAAIAQEIFGRAGTKLLPLFDSGPAGLEALRKEARDLGLVLSEADIAEAEKLTDSFGRVGDAIKAVFLRIGAVVAKPLGTVLDAVAQIAGKVNAMIDKAREEFSSLIDADAFAEFVDGLAEFVSSGVGTAVTVLIELVKGAVNAASSLIAPAKAIIGTVSNALSGGATAITEFVKNNGPLIKTIGQVLLIAAPVGAALLGIGSAAMAAGVLLPLLSGAVGFVASVLGAVAGPAIAAAAVITLIGVLARRHYQTIMLWGSLFWDAIAPARAALSELLSIVGDTFGGILAAVGQGDYAGAVSILWAGVKAVFFSAAESGVSAVMWLYDQAVAILSAVAGAITEFAGGLLGSVRSTVAKIVEFFGPIGTAIGGTFGAVFDWVSNKLGGLFQNFATVFGGIADAILAGDIQLAASILWASINLAFVAGIGRVQSLWEQFTFVLGDVFAQMGSSIMTTFLAVVSTIAGALSDLANHTATTLQALAEYDPTGAAARIAASLRTVGSVAAGAETALRNEITNTEQRRQADQLRRAAQHVDKLNAIASRADDAKAERDALIAQANEAGGDITIGTLKTSAIDDLKKQIADVNAQAVIASPEKLDAVEKAKGEADDETQRITTSGKRGGGSFSAAGAALLGLGGSSAAEETARNTRKTNEHLQAIRNQRPAKAEPLKMGP